MGAVFRVCETRLHVRYAGQVEGHDEVGDDDVNLGEGADTAPALEGLVAEIGAIGEIEHRVWVLGATAEGPEWVMAGHLDVEGGFAEGGEFSRF